MTPAVAELLDAATLRALDAVGGTERFAGIGAWLLLQTDGWGAHEELAAAISVLRAHGGDVTIAANAEEAEALLAIRRGALPAVAEYGELIIEDIAVPRSRLAQAVARIEEIAAQFGVRIFTFAHAGDGNLHPLIVVDDPSAADSAAEAIYALALELGGTITGEHGVGATKLRWAREEIDPIALELQQRIRAVFDPTGLLNPGRAI